MNFFKRSTIIILSILGTSTYLSSCNKDATLFETETDNRSDSVEKEVVIESEKSGNDFPDPYTGLSSGWGQYLEEWSRFIKNAVWPSTWRRVYKVMHLFDEGVIVDNFRNIDKYFPVKRLTSSTNPYEIAESNDFIGLPKSFPFKGEQINTQDFLDENQLEGLMIIQDDTIVFEEYRKDLKPNETHIVWSVSKSIVSALLGIAYDDGLFKLHEPITKYLPQFENTGYDNVSIKNILQMSSGVGFNEDYASFNSDINRFGRAFAFGTSIEDFSKTLKKVKEPGTYNDYVSINTQVLGMLLKKVTEMNLTDYYQQKLWEPMGMQDKGEWIIDSADMEIALGGLNMTMRDLAKIGLLFLHKGSFNNKQLISEKWVQMSTTPDASHLMPGERVGENRVQGYGFQWWIPENDDGDYFASGICDQYVYIQPKKNTVIVALSANYHFKNREPSGERKHIALFKEICKTL